MKSTTPTILISSVALVVAVVALVVAVVALAVRPAGTSSRNTSEAVRQRLLLKELAFGRAKKLAPPDDVGSDTATSGQEVETDKEIHVSLVGEEGLSASFVRKAKSEEDYEITVRFANTTDMTVTSLSTECHRYEGDRKWGSSRMTMTRYPALIAAKSHEDIIWIKGVAPSIDRIVIEVLDVN